MGLVVMPTLPHVLGEFESLSVEFGEMIKFIDVRISSARQSRFLVVQNDFHVLLIARKENRDVFPRCRLCFLPVS